MLEAPPFPSGLRVYAPKVLLLDHGSASARFQPSPLPPLRGFMFRHRRTPSSSAAAPQQLWPSTAAFAPGAAHHRQHAPARPGAPPPEDAGARAAARRYLSPLARLRARSGSFLGLHGRGGAQEPGPRLLWLPAVAHGPRHPLRLPGRRLQPLRRAVAPASPHRHRAPPRSEAGRLPARAPGGGGCVVGGSGPRRHGDLG